MDRESPKRIEALIALIPGELRPQGRRPRLDCSGSWSNGRLHELVLMVPEAPDNSCRDAIAAILNHEDARGVNRLSITRASEDWPRPADLDFGWALAAVAEAGLPADLEWLFVSEPALTTMDALGRLASKPKTVVTYNGPSRFGPGPFPGIMRLDLRDTNVEWSCGAGAFPDLETLILRPRGPKSIGPLWAKTLFDRPEVFPRVREIRGPEGYGDELLQLLLSSAVVDRLARLDFTDSLTNRGAALLCDHASKLDHIEELWVATPGDRRKQWMRFARDARSTAAPPELGELEITDDWRSRLRQHFGRRVRLSARPGHPDL